MGKQYYISAEQLQMLNVLIDKGGSGTTSKVSDSLAALEPNVMPAGKMQFDATVEYNKQNAAVYGNMQKLHNQVKKQPVDADQQPSTGTGGGGPIDPPESGIETYPAGVPTNNGTRYPTTTPLREGVTYAFQGTGKKKLSWAISSGGYPCQMSFDPANMGPAYTGGTPWIDAPSTEWCVYVKFSADPGRVQDAHIDVLDQ